MKIEQKTLDAILKPYELSARYLVKADIEYPEATGLFRISKNCYFQEGMQTGHLNAADMLICYNQLAYSFFGEAIKKGLLNLNSELNLENQLKNSLIIGMDNIKFWKPINPKEFTGKIKIEKIIPKREDLTFFKTSYNFENGKATGDIDLAFAKPQN